ncbi:MAG: hypothetical protein WD963_01935 [Candidatus Paceibacterota bacterium]
MQKIKDMLIGVTTIIVILVLGFSPSAPNLLSIKWGDIGVKMVEAGVIDLDKFENLYRERGGINPEMKSMMNGQIRDIQITKENSAMMLNMLWAFGLANKNPILEEGPMMDPRYGGAGNFASTGGWNLAQGSAMDHYSMHPFVTLTQGQQDLVEKVSKNIFRPCCQNPAYFPDCNHGMAMLGLLELMAEDGRTEDEMYKVAEEVNGYWFPEVRTGCDI